MSHFEDPAFFGEIWAHDYDGDGTWGADPGEVEFLADLASNGRALELAIGTGRVGLPLAARGVPVEGIEASEKMVAKLRAKPGGEQIPVTIGDMADVPVEGTFRLVYLIFNTLFNLIDVDRQAECFRNVARVLEPGGAFVVECPVPDQRRRDGGRHLEVLEVLEDSATIEVFNFDAAGLRLSERYANWDRQSSARTAPPTSRSTARPEPVPCRRGALHANPAAGR